MQKQHLIRLRAHFGRWCIAMAEAYLCAHMVFAIAPSTRTQMQRVARKGTKSVATILCDPQRSRILPKRFPFTHAASVIVNVERKEQTKPKTPHQNQRKFGLEKFNSSQNPDFLVLGKFLQCEYLVHAVYTLNRQANFLWLEKWRCCWTAR